MSTFLLGGGQSQLDGLLVSGTTQLSGPATFSNQPQITTPQSMVVVNTGNGFGSTNTKVRRFSTVLTTQGSDITYADSATLGASFTINTAGVYSLTYQDVSAVGELFGITIASASGATAISSLTQAQILTVQGNSAANYPTSCNVTMYFAAGTVVKPHVQNGSTGVFNNITTAFTITKVS